MLFTREVDYAVRIVRDLNRGGRKKIDEICLNELIPRQFSYKILKKLEQAGIVKIFRGAGGGYCLEKDTNEISLYDILNCINNNPLLSECLQKGYNCPLNGKDGKPCGVHFELERIQTNTFNQLKEKSLADLCLG